MEAVVFGLAAKNANSKYEYRNAKHIQNPKSQMSESRQNG